MVFTRRAPNQENEVLHPPPKPPRPTLRYCSICNCRERIIQHGVCIICHQDPEAVPA